MLTKRRFFEIVLLTLIVVFGGGYVYNSLLNDIKHISNPVQTVYNYKPGEIYSVRLDNFNKRERHRSAVRKQNKVSVPGPVATMQHSELHHETGITISENLQTSSPGYSYSVKNRNLKSNTPGSDFGSVVMSAYDRDSYRHTDRELITQNTTEICITEPGAISPFSGSMQPNSVPKQNNGLILIDPMNDPLDSERIPVGDGVWILVILAFGYVGWKKTTHFH